MPAQSRKWGPTVLQGPVLHRVLQAAQQVGVQQAAGCDSLAGHQAPLHQGAVLFLALHHLPTAAARQLRVLQRCLHQD